jgi:dihydroorotase
LDVIATDHAPHSLQEKGFHRNEKGVIVSSPAQGGSPGAAHAGLPLVQHSLLLMLHYCKQGRISLEKIVEKMSHAVADCFQIKERGYIHEGYFADLVIIDLNSTTTATTENILYKCGWSPLENMTFPARLTHTFVNGNLIYENGKWNESQKGQRLSFER